MLNRELRGAARGTRMVSKALSAMESARRSIHSHEKTVVARQRWSLVGGTRFPYRTPLLDMAVRSTTRWPRLPEKRENNGHGVSPDVRDGARSSSDSKTRSGPFVRKGSRCLRQPNPPAMGHKGREQFRQSNSRHNRQGRDAAAGQTDDQGRIGHPAIFVPSHLVGAQVRREPQLYRKDHHAP